jgi:hypothetical protein
VRIVEQGRIVRSAQSLGDFLYKNVHVHGAGPLHSATFENGNTAAIESEIKSAETCSELRRTCL